MEKSIKKFTQTPGVLTFTAKDPGTNICIIAGVHGNEKAGIKALHDLIERIESKDVQLLKGRIYIIFGNLSASAMNCRQTQVDLNTMFIDSRDIHEEIANLCERKRALELIPYLDDSDVILDIHSQPEMNTEPFILCEDDAMIMAKKLPFKICTYGWDQEKFGNPTQYARSRGKTGISIECGDDRRPETQKRAEESIETLLRIRGVARYRYGIDIIDYDQKIMSMKEATATVRNIKVG